MWKSISSIEDFQKVLGSTNEGAQDVVFFKHSTRCAISSMAKSRMERHKPVDGFEYYIILVVEQRELSNHIAQNLNVEHESPQMIVVRNGDVVHTSSHNMIQPDFIVSN